MRTLRSTLRASCLCAAVIPVMVVTASASAAAGITVLNETNTALSMQFTDAQDNTEVFNFSRPDVNAVWKSADPSAGRGIRFGNDAPVFASVRFLASRDIPILCSAVTLDSSIAQTTMEDITVFELTSDTVVVGLWNYGKITHIAWVGSLIQDARDMMEQGLFDLTPVCDAAVQRCCGTMPIPGPPEGDTFPPDAEWCELATGGGCSEEQKEAACQCVATHCDPSAPGPPSEWCQVLLSPDHCAGEPEPDPDPIEDLLQHILDLLVEMAQMIQCHLQGGQWVDGECMPGPGPQPECW